MFALGAQRFSTTLHSTSLQPARYQQLQGGETATFPVAVQNTCKYLMTSSREMSSQRVFASQFSRRVASSLILSFIWRPSEAAAQTNAPSEVTSEYQLDAKNGEADLLYYSDELSPGPKYSLRAPLGWTPLELKPVARQFGVDATFFDPLDPAATLAVYVKKVPGINSIEDEGTLDDLAFTLANAAPRQENVGKLIRKYSHNQRQRTAYEIATAVGGGTAGRFGSAVELVSVFVEDQLEYTVRITCAGPKWLKNQKNLLRYIRSFTFLN
ncbi:hypothetical protein CYMTET_44801 [Cymbomonas tetramitiformis]|uniref:PsbP C-terminal domain-containing protein n=1 Tax=Cymbomonas tetramitiformis TaxID=36881 RepID=A0AAE0BZH1_9CHLO|nr:hypothetical protein CYMTET_44801 [Cymbomonas tetramitiformis]